jgi:hypothetical protein
MVALPVAARDSNQAFELIGSYHSALHRVVRTSESKEEASDEG